MVGQVGPCRLNATFPPKRNLKVGKSPAACRATPSAVNETHPLLALSIFRRVSDLLSATPLWLSSARHPHLALEATEVCLFYPLNGCSPSTRVHRLISCRVHILLVLRPLLLSFIPSSLPATLIFWTATEGPFCLEFSDVQILEILWSSWVLWRLSFIRHGHFDRSVFLYNTCNFCACAWRGKFVWFGGN